MEKRYTGKDFAKLVGVTTMTLHRWVKSGKLPPPNRTLGGKPYYTEHHLNVVKNYK